MSALAAAFAALVALVAYLVPPPQPQPDPVAPAPTPPSWSPDPDTTRPEPPTRSSSPESSTPQPESPTREPQPASPAREAPASSPLLSAVRPGGCEDAAAALTAYQRNAGSVRSSQAAAARQAYLDLMSAVLDAEGVVGAKISLLAREFQELHFRLTGMVGGDPNQVIADINTDAAELNRLCGST
ncbi:hypothetical protein GCM10022224_000190 [Nonomuraea antimicrobica]|uniref:Uncharacterized protein n=1 Tax=Nonomuraea antimicrobica TaxID=561173 RepID=A0ABP7AX98_9ACTN